MDVPHRPTPKEVKHAFLASRITHIEFGPSQNVHRLEDPQVSPPHRLAQRAGPGEELQEARRLPHLRGAQHHMPPRWQLNGRQRGRRRLKARRARLRALLGLAAPRAFVRNIAIRRDVAKPPQNLSAQLVRRGAPRQDVQLVGGGPALVEEADRHLAVGDHQVPPAQARHRPGCSPQRHKADARLLDVDVLVDVLPAALHEGVPPAAVVPPARELWHELGDEDLVPRSARRADSAALARPPSGLRARQEPLAELRLRPEGRVRNLSSRSSNRYTPTMESRRF